MIPQHIYDAIIESPAGKLINQLIIEDRARGIRDFSPGGHGSIIDQLYETITTAQKKYRRDRVKEANKLRLTKYQAMTKVENHTVIHEQKPATVQWSALGDFMSWEPTEESDE